MSIRTIDLKPSHVGRKKLNLERERFEFIADPAWISRVNTQADRLGMSLSAYARMAITKQVEYDEAGAPPPQQRRRKKSE